MIISAKLTKREAEVIKRVALIQLNALNEIRENSCPDIDVETYFLENGVDPKEMKVFNEEKIRIFHSILKNPETFIALDGTLMGIVRHILFNYIPQSRLHHAKNRIWFKINLKEDFMYHPQ